MLRTLLPLSGLVGIATIGCTLVAGIADYEKVQGIDPADAASAADANAPERKSRYVDEVLADGPSGYWRLNDAPGEGAIDLTGKNPNGGYVAASLGAPGALSGDSDPAASFDGQTGLLSLGDRFDFSGMAPFTIELWANPASSNDGDPLLWTKGWSDSSDKAQGHYLFLNRTSVGYVRNRDGEGEGISGPAPATGTYSHIVVTFDGTTMTLHVNGTAFESKTATLSLMDSPRSFDVAQLFLGAIDELAIYDHALAAARVQRHHEVATSP